MSSSRCGLLRRVLDREGGMEGISGRGGLVGCCDDRDFIFLAIVVISQNFKREWVTGCSSAQRSALLLL